MIRLSFWEDNSYGTEEEELPRHEERSKKSVGRDATNGETRMSSNIAPGIKLWHLVMNWIIRVEGKNWGLRFITLLIKYELSTCHGLGTLLHNSIEGFPKLSPYGHVPHSLVEGTEGSQVSSPVYGQDTDTVTPLEIWEEMKA